MKPDPNRKTPRLSFSCPVLCYHHVCAPPPGHPRPAGYVLPARFAAQARLLRRLGWRSISVEMLAAALSGRARLPRRPVVWTFDDGWRDVFTQAFPILKREGFTATLFMAAGAIGENAVAFKESRDQVPAATLTLDQLRALAEAGWEIGSHGWMHRRLTRLAPDEARGEFARSRAALEEGLSRPVRVFAYPYGDFHGGAARMAAECGYLAACSMIPGRVHQPSEVLALRRVPIAHEMSLVRFAWSAAWRGYRKGAALLAQKMIETSKP